MKSVLEKRHKQAAQACLLLQRIPIEAQTHGWTPEERNYRTQETIKKLEELCVTEIMKAILDNWVEAGLCGVYVGVAQKPPYTILRILREDTETVYTGIRKAVGSVAASGVQFHEHIEACVSKNIVEESAELAKELRQLKPRALLELCTTATLRRTAFIIEHLDGEQTAALRGLLYRELGDKPRLLLMNKSPALPENPTAKQRHTYLHWYLWRSLMGGAEMRKGLGGVPRIIAVGDGSTMLMNKSTGLPADPLGPIHAKVYAMLGRELNKHGHSIKDPESKNRIAKSVGVSRATLQRYSGEVELMPDGKGGVTYKYSGDSLLAAFEASHRKRPKRRENRNT